MAKGNIIRDSFEQVVEAGGTIAKRGAKQIGKTLNPLQMIENALGEDEVRDLKNKESKTNGQNHTPLDVEKLEKKYDGEDQGEMTAVRNKLFQMVREGEQRELARKKREKEEKEREEEQEKLAKKKEEEEKKKIQQQEIPKGKQRRSIFSPAQKEHAEIKPAIGKQ